MRTDLIADALLVVALLLIVAGVALIHIPSAFIVAGAGVAVLAVWMGRGR